MGSRSKETALALVQPEIRLLSLEIRRLHDLLYEVTRQLEDLTLED